MKMKLRLSEKSIINDADEELGSATNQDHMADETFEEEINTSTVDGRNLEGYDIDEDALDFENI